ncbi:hypothetical protein BDN70DRAFT_533969 [Pholiota conissans]|uniref:Zn(2)-C6 fungal-type domain-containing protein n=1 Tax=Pholiota conissans TaxID=109636 RepID=A0A9P6D6I4_9AGAR|nr:hypothetical protein BDN70DRAFT_533969 [Pholiota conissans]
MAIHPPHPHLLFPYPPPPSSATSTSSSTTSNSNSNVSLSASSATSASSVMERVKTEDVDDLPGVMGVGPGTGMGMGVGSGAPSFQYKVVFHGHGHGQGQHPASSQLDQAAAFNATAAVTGTGTAHPAHQDPPLVRSHDGHHHHQQIFGFPTTSAHALLRAAHNNTHNTHNYNNHNHNHNTPHTQTHTHSPPSSTASSESVSPCLPTIPESPSFDGPGAGAGQQRQQGQLYRFGPTSPFASFHHPARQAPPHPHPHQQQFGISQHQHHPGTAFDPHTNGGSTNNTNTNTNYNLTHINTNLTHTNTNTQTQQTLFTNPTSPLAMSYSDDYDDGAASKFGLGLGGGASPYGVAVGGGQQQSGGAGTGGGNDRVVRRRSSKACDQCRKSKCKCERAALNEACKNCIMLGTPCTFLGPSRKRGPPKGYIDAIEARLHQTEALLGILLATEDERARGVLRDIGEDPLAREIIARVDNSPYGVKGRKLQMRAASTSASARPSGSGAGPSSVQGGGGSEKGANGTATTEKGANNASGTAKTGKGKNRDEDVDMDDEDEEGGEKDEEKRDRETGRVDLTSTHPSNEWQDRVAMMLDAVAAKAKAKQARSQSQPQLRSKSNPHPNSKSKSKSKTRSASSKAALNTTTRSRSKGRPTRGGDASDAEDDDDDDDDDREDDDDDREDGDAEAEGEDSEAGEEEGEKGGRTKRRRRTTMTRDDDEAEDVDGEDGEIDDEEDEADEDADDDYVDPSENANANNNANEEDGAQRETRAKRQRTTLDPLNTTNLGVGAFASVSSGSSAGMGGARTGGGVSSSTLAMGAASAASAGGARRAHALARSSILRPYASASQLHALSQAHGAPPSRSQLQASSSSSSHVLSHHLGHAQQQQQGQQQGMYSPYSHSSDGGAASPGTQARRTRRRLEMDDPLVEDVYGNNNNNVYARSAPGSAVSLHAGTPHVSARSPVVQQWSGNGNGRGRRGSGWSAGGGGNTTLANDVDMERRSASADLYPLQAYPGPDPASEESEDEGALVAGAVGQLSLNEDEEVRYHGKASGLYLLDGRGGKERRNEGGIWRFPKARVWPALPSASSMSSIGAVARAQEAAELPPQNVQEHLLDLYFTYVQPVFPIVHKRVFLEAYRATYGADSPSSPADPLSGAPPTHTQTTEGADASSPFGNRPARRRRAVPSLLLLAMFALASRYCDTARAAPPLPADPSTMWTAGDEYLDRAKTLLDSSYASSRPSTVQALLLLGYREIGIGAMAQAWTYIGMAIRMAQDLGMHRAADGWERVGLGGRLFGKEEISERRRVWFGCVIMDKYVSTYIGRPLMIFEWDYDTTLPDVEEAEEYDAWSVETPTGERTPADVPGRCISCFNASAELSNILSMIVQMMYAVRPLTSRHEGAAELEGMLDKWYLDLPEHLRFDPPSFSTAAPTPLPNVLTLHMQYWCAVLLLHRPYIRHVVQAKQRLLQQQQQQQGEGVGAGVGVAMGDDLETRAIAVKRFELCNAAANHITSIVSLYQEKYLITRCSVFLCYYVFTAGIMHDTNLVVHPNDPQAKIGLAKCLNVLRAMRVVWPSAARAIELFGGASTMEDINNAANPLVGLTMIDRHKRAAENALDDTFGSSPFDYMPSLRQPLHMQPQHQQQQHQQQQQTHNPQQQGHPQQQQQQQQQQHTHAAYTHEQPDSTSSVFDGDGLFLPPLPPMSSTASSAPGLVPSSTGYATPWQDPHHFNAPLSTAVLPQLYSTGLVDDGLHHHHHASPAIVRGGVALAGAGAGGVHQQQQQQQQHAEAASGNGEGHGRRYSQYMDYSGYGQMVTPYDLPQVAQQQQQHHHQQQEAQQQIYLSEQYNLYNNQPYNR